MNSWRTGFGFNVYSLETGYCNASVQRWSSGTDLSPLRKRSVLDLCIPRAIKNANEKVENERVVLLKLGWYDIGSVDNDGNVQPRSRAVDNHRIVEQHPLGAISSARGTRYSCVLYAQMALRYPHWPGHPRVELLDRKFRRPTVCCYAQLRRETACKVHRQIGHSLRLVQLPKFPSFLSLHELVMGIMKHRDWHCLPPSDF